MNITVLSLIYSSLLLKAPAFVNNRLSLMNCNFQKFSYLLFYNQKNLNIKSTLFSQGLGGIIHNEKEYDQIGNHLTVSGETFDSMYAPSSDTGLAITITECSFVNINGDSIFVQNPQISVYITSCLFNKCTASKVIIELQRSRCLTITHTCSFDSYGNEEVVFLYYDCVQEDFSICLYSTFVQTRTDKQNSVYNIKCRSGSQYFRCNNMTNCKSSAYQFDAPYCFSFSMMTVVDCSVTCLQLSGYTANQCNVAFDKTIENVNLFSNSESDGYVLRMDGECGYQITFKNSVLLCKENNKLVTWPNGKPMIVVFMNCIVNMNLNTNQATFIDSTPADFDTIHLTLLPHYTTLLCPGPKLDNASLALGCNAGNCIDSECNRTIGFPNDVVSYTTILHLDINTPTPSPTEEFSQSDKFSQSSKFTYSHKFSESHPFDPTIKFTGSSFFTQSTKFSESVEFTKSSDFTFSIQFTSSKKFTDSNHFDATPSFTPSSNFTSSSKFTSSGHFSLSNNFSSSNQFTATDNFILTNHFSPSTKFNASNHFTSSDHFTVSSKFTSSKKFTISDKFSSSNAFNMSMNFTASSLFIPTNVFLVSDMFTKSSVFSKSSVFTNSNHFSMSPSFSSSDVIEGGNIGVGERGSNAAKIGIIAGASVAAAAAIIAVVAFFIIRHHRKMIPTSDFNMMETNENEITIENDLDNIMNEDDPFKDDF